MIFSKESEVQQVNNLLHLYNKLQICTMDETQVVLTGPILVNRSSKGSQFECQRQNTWWNSKMVTVRIITTVFILILVGSILVVLLPNNSILNILLCSAGILIKICERMIENWRYFRISRLIEGAQQAIEVHPTAEGVKKLQNLIDERRSINVLEFGYFHKKLANKLSGLYKNISL